MSNRPLYLVLEVSADATNDELKKSYHRLALLHHPDKAGPESAEKFQQILAAYTLLSDPEAREMYDRYGEQGLNNIEAMPAMAEVGRKISIISFFRVGFAIGAFICLNLTVLFILLSLKLDGHARYSWHTAVFPAYILFIAFALATIVATIFRIKKYIIAYCKRATNDDPRTPTTQLFDDILLPNNRTKLMREVRFWLGHVISMCAILTIVLAIISVAQREPHGSKYISWWVVFSPAFIANVISLFTALIFRDLLHMYGVHGLSTFGLVVLNTMSMCMALLRITQIVLVLCMLEGYFDAPAYYVALPAEIYIVLNCGFLLLMTWYRVLGVEKIKREMPYMSEEDQQKLQQKSKARPSWWIEVAFVVLTSFFMLCGLVLSTVAYKLGFEYRYAFVPFFILFGGLLLVFLVLFACFSIASVAEKEAEAERQRQKQEQRAAQSEDDCPPFSPKDGEKHSRESRDSNDTQGESNPNKPTSPITPCPKNASRRSDDCHVECCDDIELGHHQLHKGRHSNSFHFEFNGDRDS